MTGVRPPSENLIIEGPAGLIDCLIDWPLIAGSSLPLPEGASGGLALIGHPHPLYGGTRDNKVAATLARAFASLGWVSVRPNFRGVGRSAGIHDNGLGETDDFAFLTQTLPALPVLQTALGAHPAIALAGFSFGSFVAARTAQRLTAQQQQPQALVLVGTAAGKWDMPPVPSSAFVIHGEDDTTIPLSDVMTWSRTSDVPVTVLPGTDHFFHRKLTILKTLVQRHLLGLAAQGWPRQGVMFTESTDHD